MFLLSCLETDAQFSSVRKKKIIASGIVQIDSLSIVPGTFSATGIDTSYYLLDFVNATIIWKGKITFDSVDITYRVFPFKLNAVAQRFSFDSIRNNFIAMPSVQGASANRGNALFNFGKLNYGGSFGRSLSFGNTQDAVFNTRFK